MLVYGDHCEIAEASRLLDGVSAALDRVRHMPPGLERHSRLVGALIESGQLLQAVADEGAPLADLDRFVHGLARSVVSSFDSHFDGHGELPPMPTGDLPQRVELRLPEGFAFYAVYPESYVEAARKVRLSGRARVIGIRSIGATLGPVVAAALGAPPSTSVRPFGDPFARQVELPDDLVDEEAHYVIVDEGPGLSGSSFGAVADWLEARGVPLDRIAFLPSHEGDLGPHASAPHRQRWRRAQRVPARFDRAFLVRELGELREFGGGGPSQRLKFLGTLGGVPVLLKFAGLGALGQEKFAMAQALHAAGLTPEPLTYVHGFIVERWHADAQSARHEKPVEEIGHYLALRSSLFPAADGSGASIEKLKAMCSRNISLALGESAARLLERFDTERLSRLVRRVRTDNKLDREEWLRLPDGRLLKTDALDHHRAHDLIGCQGVEWDVAGAIVEFDLEPGDALRLIGATRQPVSGELLEFYLLAYVAFRLGQAELASRETDSAFPYRAALDHLLQEGSFVPDSAQILG